MNNQTINRFLVISLTCKNFQNVVICSCSTFYWLVKKVGTINDDVAGFFSKFGRQSFLCYALTTLSLNDETKRWLALKKKESIK